MNEIMPTSPEMDKADARDRESDEVRRRLFAPEPPHKTIPLAEIFGPTIQGEGLLAGRPTYFVRVGGCDFKCAWCDTDQAVLADKVRLLERVTVPEIINRLINWADDNPGPDWLAISGGNPGMYDLGELVAEWQATSEWPYQRRVTVETQGSRWQPWFAQVNVLTVSPKPPSSGMTNQFIGQFIGWVGEVQEQWYRDRLRDPGIPEDYHQMVLKCICFDDDDYQFARDLHIRYPMIPFYLSSGTAMGGLTGRWVPPPIPGQHKDDDRFNWVRSSTPDGGWTRSALTDTKESLLARYRWLVERMMNDDAMSNVAVFPQIHALVWGINTRGV